jgi:hypothetical protein
LEQRESGLVWARRAQAEASDAGQDLVSRLEPREGLGLGVGPGDEDLDVMLEIGDAAVNPAPDLLVRQERKPTLDLVDPRG